MVYMIGFFAWPCQCQNHKIRAGFAENLVIFYNNEQYCCKNEQNDGKTAVFQKNPVKKGKRAPERKEARWAGA